MRTLNKIILVAKRRLLEDDRHTLVTKVENVLYKHHLTSVAQSHAYPSTYRIATQDPSILDKVKHDLETEGFKFKPIDLYSPSTKAVESVGNYHSLSYIIDLVFHHDAFKVDIYY